MAWSWFGKKEKSNMEIALEDLKRKCPSINFDKTKVVLATLGKYETNKMLSLSDYIMKNLIKNKDINCIIDGAFSGSSEVNNAFKNHKGQNTITIIPRRNYLKGMFSSLGPQIAEIFAVLKTTKLQLIGKQSGAKYVPSIIHHTLCDATSNIKVEIHGSYSFTKAELQKYQSSTQYLQNYLKEDKAAVEVLKKSQNEKVEELKKLCPTIDFDNTKVVYKEQDNHSHTSSLSNFIKKQIQEKIQYTDINCIIDGTLDKTSCTSYVNNATRNIVNNTMTIIPVENDQKNVTIELGPQIATILKTLNTNNKSINLHGTENGAKHVPSIINGLGNLNHTITVSLDNFHNLTKEEANKYPKLNKYFKIINNKVTVAETQKIIQNNIQEFAFVSKKDLNNIQGQQQQNQHDNHINREFDLDESNLNLDEGIDQGYFKAQANKHNFEEKIGKNKNNHNPEDENLNIPADNNSEDDNLENENINDIDIPQKLEQHNFEEKIGDNYLNFNVSIEVADEASVIQPMITKIPDNNSRFKQNNEIQ